LATVLSVTMLLNNSSWSNRQSAPTKESVSAHLWTSRVITSISYLHSNNCMEIVEEDACF